VVACQAEITFRLWARIRYCGGTGKCTGFASIAITRAERSTPRRLGGEGNRELPRIPRFSCHADECVHCELARARRFARLTPRLHDEEGVNVMAYNRCIGTLVLREQLSLQGPALYFFDWNSVRSISST